MAIPLITHPAYSFDFPGNHRFPMEKFGLLHRRLQQLGLATADNTLRPGKARYDVLARAHDQGYLDRFFQNRQTPAEIRRMGLPWSEALAHRTRIAPNGTLLTATLALQQGIACHMAGGTHHAHRDFASGFCILNDLAITALALLNSPDGLKTGRGSVLIFDCDVHQGDGTAAILAGESRAFTCSIHCENNFPVRKANSDLDVGLPAGTGDDQYLQTVEHTLLQAIDRSRPALILYDAGVDIYSGDPLGLLEVSLEGLRQREHTVLSLCQRKGIPVAVVIGGGYDNDREALARRHSMVFEEAFRLHEPHAFDPSSGSERTVNAGNQGEYAD